MNLNGNMKNPGHLPQEKNPRIHCAAMDTEGDVES